MGSDKGMFVGENIGGWTIEGKPVGFLDNKVDGIDVGDLEFAVLFACLMEIVEYGRNALAPNTDTHEDINGVQ